MSAEPVATLPQSPAAEAPRTLAGWVSDRIRAEDLRERRLPHVLLAAVVLFFVIAIAWAAFFEIEEVARGEGRVITRSHVQVITNLEGGIIDEILVSEGDRVKKGDPLIRIDPTRFEAAYKEGEQSAAALKARIARLSAEAQRGAFQMLAEVRKLNPTVQAAIAEARGKPADTEATSRAQAGGELAQAAAELAKISQQMPALEDRATRTIVRAPMDGIVKTIPNRTIGGVVRPGSPMVEMVPVENKLLVETRLKPSDIAFVRVGSARSSKSPRTITASSAGSKAPSSTSRRIRRSRSRASRSTSPTC